MPDTPNSSGEVVVTDRPGAETPTVRPMAWWQIVLVRAARAALIAFAAVLWGDQAGAVPAPPGDRWLYAASVAGFAALSSAVLNVTELLTKIDQSHPGWRG